MNLILLKKQIVGILMLTIVLSITSCGSTLKKIDLSQWALDSSSLSSSVRNETTETLKQIDSIITSLELDNYYTNNEKEQIIESWKKRRTLYRATSNDINATFAFMELYAEAISNLGSEGKKGRENATQIQSSVSNIVTLVGKSFAPTEIVTTALQEISDSVTQFQAEKSLAKIMPELNKSVTKLKDVIIEGNIDSDSIINIQKRIISNIRAAQIRIRERLSGDYSMEWYENNREINLYETFFRCLLIENDKINGRKVEQNAERECRAIEKMKGYNKDPLTYVLLQERLENVFRQRQVSINKIKSWHDDRFTALDNIERSAALWSDAHSEAASLLLKCGGSKSLRKECRTASFRELKLSIDNFKNLQPQLINGR